MKLITLSLIACFAALSDAQSAKVVDAQRALQKMGQIKESALLFESQVNEGLVSDLSGFSRDDLLRQCKIAFKEVRAKSQLFRYDNGNTYRKFASKALNMKKSCESQAQATGRFVEEKQFQLGSGSSKQKLAVEDLISAEADAAIQAQNQIARQKADEAIRSAFQNAKRQALEQQRIKKQQALTNAQQTNNACINEWTKLNKQCDEALSADKFLIGDDYDSHYDKTRMEFADCIYQAKSKYNVCKSYKRCDNRMKESKGKCDEGYQAASKAKLRSIRLDFDSMDKCYTKSLKLHWKCNDQVNNYERVRLECDEKSSGILNELSSTWIKGGPGTIFDEAPVENTAQLSSNSVFGGEEAAKNDPFDDDDSV